MDREQSIALIQEIYEAFNRRDMDKLDELFDPAYEDHSVGTPLPIPFDRQALKGLLQMYFTAFPDCKFTVSDFTLEGDKAAWRDRLTGTHQGELMGIPATGRSVDVSGMSMGEIRNGKAIRHYSVFDNLGLMQQLGVIPAPGA
ncbi:MAG TPA: ester cyclase [Chloroflexia bacterium]|nr:ester cyclase [Chloroflexia bacterium]